MSIKLDISKCYPGFTLKLAFEAGNETLGFLGASGCGKSLTLRCIAGLVTPDEGRIEVNGQVFFDSSKRINLKPQQRKTALLFQDYQLFPNLSAEQNIAAGLPRGLSREEARALVQEQLVRFGLEKLGGRYPAELSGGQQQRVALARMLAAKPGILMLDEPFSALDAHLKAELEEELINLFECFDGTVLYVSHDIDEAFRYCDRIAVVDNGGIEQLALAHELVSAPSTLAALKVSGVKNISRARRLSEYSVEALDWGLTLNTDRPVPNEVRWVAVRASHLRPATPTDTANTFEFTVRFTSESRFDRTVIFDPGGIRWLADKLSIELAALPQKGQSITMHLPPEQLYLVT